jgi:hypothetical protein
VEITFTINFRLKQLRFALRFYLGVSFDSHNESRLFL